MNFPVQLTFLGTGSVKGRPVYGCGCPTCFNASMDPFLARRPASALLEIDGEQYLLDAGLTDLEERLIPGSVKGILLTHFHMDHMVGLFSLRWGENLQIPVYAPNDPVHGADLLKYPGILDFSAELTAFESFQLGTACITPLPLQHSRLTFDYSIQQEETHIAYLTDTDGLPQTTIAGSGL